MSLRLHDLNPGDVFYLPEESRDREYVKTDSDYYDAVGMDGKITDLDPSEPVVRVGRLEDYVRCERITRVL